MNWQNDKAWADQFTRQIVEILRHNSAHILKIEVAPMEADSLHATDMIITVTGGNVAVRVRRDTSYRDFTIRSARASGTKTELQKLREGFGDWYLYAWSQGDRITEWMLLDLHRIRQQGLLNREWPERLNKDGRTSFIAIPISVLALNACIVTKDMD